MLVLVLFLVFCCLCDVGAAQRQRPRRRTPSSSSSSSSSGSNVRIIGGVEERDRSRVPYVVSLRIRGPQGMGKCSGSIYSATQIISAAHCFCDRFSQGRQTSFDAEVTIAHDVQRDAPIYRSVGSVTINPNFARGGGMTAEYDQAVITLTDPIPLGTPGVQAIPLATRTPNLGVFALATGYGIRRYTLDEDSPIARSILSPTTQCPPYVAREVICTRGIDENRARGTPCMGDSGGPLVFEGTLIGILSRGSRDCGADGTENTILWNDVAQGMDWLRENLGGGRNNGGSSRPNSGGSSRPNSGGTSSRPVAPPNDAGGRDGFVKYTLRRGDTLEAIAVRFGITRDDIIRFNSDKPFEVGVVLDIPTRSASGSSISFAPPPQPPTERPQPPRGNSIISTGSVIGGEVIGGNDQGDQFRAPPPTERPTSGRVHVVRQGDTYYSLGRLYFPTMPNSQSAARIQAANRGVVLRVGSQIIIP